MTGTRSVLIIDEFPPITDLTFGTKNQKIGSEIVQMLRTIFEDCKKTKLVVSGSCRETLNNLVAKYKAPFYRQLLLREIHPFDKRDFDKFLRHYLPHMKYANKEVKSELYRVTSGIPYNLQLVGKEIQYLEIKRLDVKKISKAVKSVFGKEGNQAFREFTENLYPTEIKVLKGLSKIPDSTPIEITKNVFINHNSANSALNLLRKKGIICKMGCGKYEFADNLFAEWFKYQDSLRVYKVRV